MSHGPHIPSYRWTRATGACGGAPTLWLGRMGGWQPLGARQRRRPRCPTPPTTAAGAGASRAAARRRSGGSCGQAPVLQGRAGGFSTCLLGAQLQEKRRAGWPQKGGRVGCVGGRLCCTVAGLGQVLAAGWRCRVWGRECPMNSSRASAVLDLTIRWALCLVGLTMCKQQAFARQHACTPNTYEPPCVTKPLP